MEDTKWKSRAITASNVVLDRPQHERTGRLAPRLGAAIGAWGAFDQSAMYSSKASEANTALATGRAGRERQAGAAGELQSDSAPHI
jgi:hypothetical protein